MTDTYDAESGEALLTVLARFGERGAIVTGNQELLRQLLGRD